jgi:hypothetical protein
MCGKAEAQRNRCRSGGAAAELDYVEDRQPHGSTFQSRSGMPEVIAGERSRQREIARL